MVKPLFEVVAMEAEKRELSERIERRLEMIHAHTNMEKPSDLLLKSSMYRLAHSITGIPGM